jgi:5-oxoprolinase (ATP-hydrolysing) subunit C
VTLEVIDPGLLTTVQDAGRPDWTHLGVPTGGACDGWSLAVANLLAANRPGAAALEMTIAGGTFRATAPVRIGIAGADLGGHVRETGRRLSPGRSHDVAAGSTIAFPGVADIAAGARAYVAVPGGIDVPEVLGSRSTALAAGFGGLDGRALRSRDVLVAARAASVESGNAAVGAVGGERDTGEAWPDSIGLAGDPDRDSDAPIRIIGGPWSGIGDLVGRSWRIAPGSDRVGLRLEGPVLGRAGPPDILSFGVVPGVIQVPPDGSPIVLLADAQTTGGYPVAAVVIAADIPRLAQLRPGAEIRFEEVSIAAATEAIRRQQAALARGAVLLHESAAWNEAWRGAGA